MEIKRVGITEVLGKEVVFYDSWEEPLFLANDIASWLEERDGYTVSRKVSHEEKTLHTICVSGQEREYTLITEDGLYELLMLSRKAIAKPLKREIKNYLKQIRRTGGAVESGREEEFIFKYFPSFSEDVKMSMVQDLLKTNKELKPKAEYYDKTLKPSFLKTTTEVAKDLGMTAQALNNKLYALRVIRPRIVNGKTKGWLTYAEYDYLVPEYLDYHITEYNQTLKFTEKGREWVVNLLSEDSNNGTGVGRNDR